MSIMQAAIQNGQLRQLPMDVRYLQAMKAYLAHVAATDVLITATLVYLVRNHFSALFHAALPSKTYI